MKKEINIDEIRKLEKKRREFLEKMQKLKEKEKNTKPHIFKKVFSEYEEKLKKVEEELEKRKGGIKDYLESLYTSRKEVEKVKLKIEDEIEEIKLRYSIGEYDEEKYRTLMDEKNSELKKVKEKFITIEKEINELALLLKKDEKPITKVEEEIEVEPELKEIRELEEVVENEIKMAEKAETEVEEELMEIEEILEEVEAEKTEEKEAYDVSVNEKLLEDLGKESRTEERGEVICKKCGHKNSPDSWFCENCGAELIIELE